MLKSRDREAKLVALEKAGTSGAEAVQVGRVAAAFD